MRKTFDVSIDYQDTEGNITTKSYKAIPDFAARSRVEERLGSPVIIMQRIGKWDIRLLDLVVVIHSCILSSGEAVKEQEIGEALNDMGLESASDIALPLLQEWLPDVEKKTRKKTGTALVKKRTKSR